MNTTTVRVYATIHTFQESLGVCTCGVRIAGWDERATVQNWQRHLDADTLNQGTKVGDFATYCIGSDRYAVEVIARTAKSITVRDATVIHSADRTYERGQGSTFAVLPNEAGSVRKFTLRRDGAWRSVGCNFDRLSLGRVDDYRDPSF